MVKKDYKEEIDLFCSILTSDRMYEKKKMFKSLSIESQKEFLHFSWKILSNPEKYNEDSYLKAFHVFKLFRTDDMKRIKSYKEYKNTNSDKAYRKAYAIFKDNMYRESKISKTPIKKTPLRKTTVKTTPVKRTPVKRTTTKRTGVKRTPVKRTSVKKYDKEYQRAIQPSSNSSEYSFYTSLYKQKPKSKLAITWLTEKGIFEGREREKLIKQYIRLKDDGELRR